VTARGDKEAQMVSWGGKGALIFYFSLPLALKPIN